MFCDRKGQVKRRRIRGKSKRHKRASRATLPSFQATLLPIPEAHYVDETEDHNNCHHPRKKRRHDGNDSCHQLSVNTSLSPLSNTTTIANVDANEEDYGTTKVVHAISPTCTSPVPKTSFQQSRPHCKTTTLLISNDMDGDDECNANAETATIIHDGGTKDDALLDLSSLVDDFTSQFANAVLSRDLRVLKRALRVVEESSTGTTPRWMHTLACGTDGNTLLMLAVMTQWREGIELFCARGWNIHQKNKQGKTALGIAMTLRDPGIALLLLRIH
eukprot:scaffold2912_cov67-Attheya_sp.AAC.6